MHNGTSMKTKVRVVFAVAVCKLLRSFLHFLGHGGTNLPGKFALKICPEILSVAATGVRTIIVSGTNGKTTTCRLIEQGLNNAGVPCFANRSGANLLPGIVAEFIANANRNGMPSKAVSVIECDEATLKAVLSFITPEIVVLTNIFRDQLDRYGEVTHTLEKLSSAIEKTPNTLLCLNADDSLVASIAQALPNPCVFYGINAATESAPSDTHSDALYCICCKQRYAYTHRTYGHLGSFRCPNCGYKRSEPQISVDRIIETNRSKSIVDLNIRGQHTLQTIPLPALYNIYNYLAAISALDAFGVPEKDLKCVGAFGRMEHFSIGKGIALILVKNPAGFTQVIEYLSDIKEEYDLMCCLNDQEVDGTDISWIWDVPFEKLSQENDLKTVFVAGIRKEEMYLRLKHAGLDESKLQLVANTAQFIRETTKHPRPLFIVPTYTAMMQIRKQLAGMDSKKAFWE